MKAQPNSISNNKAFTLSGKVSNAPDGTIYLFLSTAHGSETDSAFLRNNQFHFRGEIAEPTFAELSLYSPSNPKYSAEVFIEPGKMEIVAQKGDFRNLKLKGSASQKDFEKLVEMKKENRSKHDSLWEKHYSLQKEIEINEQASGTAGKQNVDSLQKEKRKVYNSISLIERAMSRSDSLFIVQNPSSYVTAYLILTNMKIEGFKLFPVDSLYYNMPDPVRNTSYGKRILWQMNAAKIAPAGKAAPLFISKDQHGNLINLSDFRSADYVLLDFWGSWCGICRIMNPNIKTFYQKYSNKGLRIISIAINDKEKSWRKAIDDDQTSEWIQILDDSNSSIKNSYAADFVPIYFLIDKNGIIVGKYAGGAKGYGEKSFDELNLELQWLFEKNVRSN